MRENFDVFSIWYTEEQAKKRFTFWHSEGHCTHEPQGVFGFSCRVALALDFRLASNTFADLSFSANKEGKILTKGIWNQNKKRPQDVVIKSTQARTIGEKMPFLSFGYEVEVSIRFSIKKHRLKICSCKKKLFSRFNRGVHYIIFLITYLFAKQKFWLFERRMLNAWKGGWPYRLNFKVVVGNTVKFCPVSLFCWMLALWCFNISRNS